MRVTAPGRIVAGGWQDSFPFNEEYPGYVFNAAINLRAGVDFSDGCLKIEDEQLKGCHGLGASASRDTAMLVARHREFAEDKIDLIKKVWIFQNLVLGHRAGIQDQAAAVFGGANLWYFGPGPIETKTIDKISISEKDAEHFRERFVLFNTNESHLSSNIHNLVFGQGNYVGNIPKLKRLSQISYETASSLSYESKLAELLNESWEIQKTLHQSIETLTMIRFQQAFKGLYSAFIVPGAGGGGCIGCYTSNPKDLVNKVRSSGDFEQLTHIPLEFDYEGVKIED